MFKKDNKGQTPAASTVSQGDRGRGYAELNLSAQDVEDQEIGAGFVDGEIGLQTRYEVTRKFAPYVDVRYERKFGETSSIAKSNGEGNDNFVASAGLRLMFQEKKLWR